MAIEQIFRLSNAIRYVALYRAGNLTMRQRPDLDDASSNESDKFEELLVNPALLKLAQQRGDIDCGGANFVVVGYGKFLQLVISLADGHVSVAFEHAENPLQFVEKIRKICLDGDSG